MRNLADRIKRITMIRLGLCILFFFAEANLGNCQQPDYLFADVAINLSFPSSNPDLLSSQYRSPKIVLLGESYFNDCVVDNGFEECSILNWSRYESLTRLFELQAAGLGTKSDPTLSANDKILVARWTGTLGAPDSPRVKLELTEAEMRGGRMDKPEGHFINLIWEDGRFELRIYEKTTRSTCRYIREETKLVNVIVMSDASSSQAMVLQPVDGSMAVPRIRICVDGTAEILDMASSALPLEALLDEPNPSPSEIESRQAILRCRGLCNPSKFGRSVVDPSILVVDSEWEPRIALANSLSGLSAAVNEIQRNDKRKGLQIH
jgi:hypothetical protein